MTEWKETLEEAADPRLELGTHMVSSLLSLSHSSLLNLLPASLTLPVDRKGDAGTTSSATPVERNNFFSPVCVQQALEELWPPQTKAGPPEHLSLYQMGPRGHNWIRFQIHG